MFQEFHHQSMVRRFLLITVFTMATAVSGATLEGLWNATVKGCDPMCWYNGVWKITSNDEERGTTNERNRGARTAWNVLWLHPQLHP